jgi:hypothetical protein
VKFINQGKNKTTIKERALYENTFLTVDARNYSADSIFDRIKEFRYSVL